MNFYEVVGEDLVCERTFERGVEDFTYACGTGTGSVATVLTLPGPGQRKRGRVHEGRRALGCGACRLQVTPTLYLTGPTNIVCKGELTDEDLPL